MLAIYLAGLVAGGSLLLFSIFGSGTDQEATGESSGVGTTEPGTGIEGDADLEAGADADGSTDAHGDADAPGVGLSALTLAALPVRSLRFWTFFLAFGGLAGTLLTWLAPLGTVTTAIVAAAIGWATGAGVTAFMRWAAQSQVSSTLRPDACVGATGTVVLPVAPGARGRIRVALEDQMIDFDAETEDERELGTSEPVVVYALRDDGVALVTSTSRP